LFSHGTAALATPHAPHTAAKRGDPVSGRERNTLPAAKGRASPGLLLRCGAGSREAKPRKARRDGFALLTRESLKMTHTDFPPRTKPLFSVSTRGCEGKWLADCVKVINFYALWLFANRKPFKQ